MRKRFAIAIVLSLAACAHKPEPTSCPAPPGELLVPPAPLPKLDDTKPMTLEDVVTAWLNDTEAHRVTLLRLGRLQAWGVAQCGWPG